VQQAEVVDAGGRVEYEYDFVAAGAMKPADVLPVGLAVLSALAELCRSGSASLVRRAAWAGRA
jgi:hypothetical protein